MGVLIKVIDSTGVEVLARRDPMHLVALRQEEFRQIATVLPGDAGDEGGFGRVCGHGGGKEVLGMSLRGTG